MNNDRIAAKPILYEEAVTLTNAIRDERLRNFVIYGLSTVLVRRGMNPDIKPQADFDLHFFAEVLRAMGDNHTTLPKILRGDVVDMEWWPEEW